MKPLQADLLARVNIRNRTQYFYAVESIGTSFLRKTFHLHLICHLVSDGNILIPFCFCQSCFFSIKGEPGRNGNPGEVGFAGSI